MDIGLKQTQVCDAVFWSLHFDFCWLKDKSAQIFNQAKYSESKLINKSKIQHEFYIP